MKLSNIGSILRISGLHSSNVRSNAVAWLLCTCGAVCSHAQTTSPQQIFEQAVQAQQRGDDAVAVRKYREILALHPEALAVRVNLGVTLEHLQRYSEAINQYRIVLASDPKNRLARMNLALAFQENGQLEPAINELVRLHHEDPKDEQAVMMLADCEVRAGRGSDAVALLAPMDSSQPDDPDLEWLLGSALIEAGRPQEGVERVEKAAEKGANVDAWLLAGRTRLELSQFDLARKDADAAKLANSNVAGLQTLFGMIQEQTADYEGAEVSLLNAVAANEKDFNAQYYLGAIYYFKRDLVKARVQLTRALQLQPASAQARFELALVDRAEGQLDAALQGLQTVVQQSPDWLQPHIELSALYYRLHRPDDGEHQKQIVDRLIAAQQQSESQKTH